MTITSTLRFLHGCFEDSNNAGTFIIPGLMKLSTDGVFFADVNGQYHTDTDLINFDPTVAGGGTNGITIQQVLATPLVSNTNVLVCDGTGPDPVETPLCIFTDPKSKCPTALKGDASMPDCNLIGGHSCDVILTTDQDTLKTYFPQFMLEQETFKVIDAVTQQPIVLPVDADSALTYDLQDSTIYELRFSCVTESSGVAYQAPEMADLHVISANDPTTIAPSCQSNPMGACELLSPALG